MIHMFDHYLNKHTCKSWGREEEIKKQFSLQLIRFASKNRVDFYCELSN